jgi:hypothetical protein
MKQPAIRAQHGDTGACPNAAIIVAIRPLRASDPLRPGRSCKGRFLRFFQQLPNLTHIS